MTQIKNKICTARKTHRKTLRRFLGGGGAVLSWCGG
jgi:hypothetical protein